jgi:hypothetical protein
LKFISKSTDEDSVISIHRHGNIENISIYYNITGKSDTWMQYTFGTEIKLKENEVVYFDNKGLNILSFDKDNYLQFEISGKVYASGNIQSLVGYTNNCPSYCYYNLFKDCTGLITSPDLPAIELNDSCY